MGGAREYFSKILEKFKIFISVNTYVILYVCESVFAVYERFMQFVVCKLYICENKRYEYVIYKLDGAKHSRVGFKIFNYQCNMSFNQ